MNHNRSCANDSASSSSFDTLSIAPALTPIPALCCSSILLLSPATVGLSNTHLSGTSALNACLTRDTICVASNECPPSSKKFSSTPTCSRPSTSPQIPASTSSAAVRGTNSIAASLSSLLSLCSAFLSTFPFSVSGIPSTFINSDGTLYCGSISSSFFRNSLVFTPPSSPTTYATSRLPAPPAPPSAVTTASLTPLCFTIAASISAGSIRYPLIFTCRSFRP